jgi:hypothetical protein
MFSFIFGAALNMNKVPCMHFLIDWIIVGKEVYQVLHHFFFFLNKLQHPSLQKRNPKGEYNKAKATEQIQDYRS